MIINEFQPGKHYCDRSCMLQQAKGYSVFFFGRRRSFSLGSFGNDDLDGNQDVKKVIGLLRKTTTLHEHHAFLYISLPSQHDYDVKMSNCKFYGGRKQATTNLLFLSLNLSAVLKKSTPGKFA